VFTLVINALILVHHTRLGRFMILNTRFYFLLNKLDLYLVNIEVGKKLLNQKSILHMYLGYEVFIVGLILSADSFSAAVAMGLRPFSKKDAFKFAFLSGGCEAVVTLIGAKAGEYLISHFQSIDHWIAFSLLMAVALHMAYEGFHDLISKKIKEEKLEFHSLLKILIVSLATSLDAFGVGIGLGISNKPISSYIISIGVCAFLATIAGLYLAKNLSKKFSPIITLFGAIILGIIAFEMLKI